MLEGVLYIARGERYVEAAVESARSVRRFTPGIPIAIATDGPAPAEFDHAIPIDEPDGYRAKIVGMIASPFERTLMLDVDTYAAADPSEALQVLDYFDVAAAHAPNRVVLPLDDVPDSFPELNTGVVAYRRTERVDRLFQDWLDEYDRLAPLKPSSKDQPSFRRAVYDARDVRLAVLPPEFNLRFWMAGYYNQHVRILHGWADRDTFEKVAALLNAPATNKRYRGVFIGRALLDKRAEVVGRFPEGPARFRPEGVKSK
jgi:rhodanese-related sulfurtransferase